MNITRRSVMVQGGVMGAAVIASNLPAASIVARAAGLPQRVSLQGLDWKDPPIAGYIDGVRLLKAAAPSETFSWINLSLIHGNYDPQTGRGGYNYCPHGNWYFLPWHRAYLVTYERSIRQLISSPDWALPYWDWTNEPVMPEFFTSPTLPDGSTNPLYVDEEGVTRTWPSDEPMPDDEVGQAVYDKIMSQSPFEVFGTSRPAYPRPQNTLNPKWIKNGSGTQGELEGNPHNNVHNNIGGWMPSPSSPRDPIFFMHHSNIDRIWATWNLDHHNSPNKLWLDMPFNDNFYNPDGSFWSPKVSDLLSTDTLGYSYGLTASAIAAKRVLPLDVKLADFFANPHAKQKDVAVFKKGRAAPAATENGVALSVAVGAQLMGAVAKRKPVNGLLAGPVGPKTSVFCFLRDVEATDVSTTRYRVFIAGDGIGPDTPTTDPHYVGMFGIFDHSMGMEDEPHKPSFSVNLTEAVARVYGDKPAPSHLGVQVVPVPDRPGQKAGTVTVGSTDIVFITA